MTFAMNVTLENVDRTGVSFKGTISLKELYKALTIPVLHYCPSMMEFDSERVDYEHLIGISNPEIPFDQEKVNEMAILYLQDQLYWTDLIWNVRRVSNEESLVYHDATRTLSIYNTITIPDSKHKHKAYYQLIRWKNGLELIPEKVLELSHKEIEELLINFDENRLISVIVHHLYPEQERDLHLQTNRVSFVHTHMKQTKLFYNDNKVDLFLSHLLSHSTIFSEKEVELNRITIHKKSRKLVPKSTLETAYKPICANLTTKEYDDFTHFIDDFYTALSSVYQEIKPTASAVERHQSRKESLIINNIMFSPLAQIAYEVWSVYRRNQVSWKNDSFFNRVIEGLTRSITLKDRNGQLHNVNIMSKQNIHWSKKIVNDQQLIVNNRISQRFAYDYLKQACKLDSVNKETKGI